MVTHSTYIDMHCEFARFAENMICVKVASKKIDVLCSNQPTIISPSTHSPTHVWWSNGTITLLMLCWPPKCG
jgi:hypothetical protein